MSKLARGAALLVVSWLAFGASPSPASLKPDDVLSHLEQVVSWYRRVSSGEPASATPGDLILRENTRESAAEAVRLAFQFARAEAALLTAAPPSGQSESAAGNTFQPAAEKAADRVQAIEARLAAIDSEVARAAGKQREILVAQRGELQAELDLAKEIQSTLEDMLRFSGAVGGTGLAGKVNEIARSVPEIQSGAQKTTASNSSAQAAAEPRLFHAETAGIISLIGELLSLHGSTAQIKGLVSDTDNLLADIEKLKVPLVNQAHSMVTESDQITSAAGAASPDQIAQAERQIGGLKTNFQHLSTAIVPLGEEQIAVGNVRGNLQEELNGYDSEYGQAGRYLLVRGGTMGFVISIVLLVSALWRRATFRYVHDSRRRRQFLVLRRVVVALAVTMTVVLGLVTEFGSLATYAGFVTAGLAVALQNVILSIVAYFFLIGRYGIRAGDRVTISGVTGDVIDIGLVRMSMMELGADMHSTGRLVVYSNSVIFQPSAFFKQIPGINYVWHAVTLTLAADSDFQDAEKKLNDAVDAVYGKYRAAIEKQHASFEESLDVEVNAPKPESRLRFTDAGLTFSVRYPAEMTKASATDDQMMKALWDVIESDPNLKFAPSGTPKLQAVN